MRARRLAARWLIPVEGPAIERAALLVDPDGRVAAVGRDASVPRPSGILAEDFGEAVILPGLINTHTHLELTGFGDQVQERQFAAWIKRLRELKATRSSAEYLKAAKDGLHTCYAAGVTTVADTGDSGAVVQALAECSGSGVAYQEVFGPHPVTSRREPCRASRKSKSGTTVGIRQGASGRLAPRSVYRKHSSAHSRGTGGPERSNCRWPST